MFHSMTPLFSAVLNFSIKAVLKSVHTLNYLSTVESTKNIMFPRVKKHLLQLNQVSNKFRTMFISKFSLS